MKDLQFEENGSVFNCRVNGVLVKEGKVLLSAKPGLIHLCEKDFSNGTVAQVAVPV